MLAGLWPAGIYKIAASRQRSAALVVGIGVVKVKSDITCPYYPARIIFLQLNTRQEKQVIKKIIMEKAECIYIDLVVILLKPVGESLIQLPKDREAMICKLLQVAIGIIGHCHYLVS